MRASEYIAAMTLWPALLAIVLSYPHMVQGASADDHHDTLTEKLQTGNYSRRGADECLGCHDETFPFPTDKIFHNAHGQSIPHSPFAQNSDPKEFPAGLQCEACHGPAGDHSKQVLVDEAARQPMINFGKRANAGADLQNSMCLNCHNSEDRIHWLGSTHETSDLACADCHQLHSAEDPVKKPESQAQTCNKCHNNVAADTFKHSAHPIKEGQLTCDDCHRVHGTGDDKLLSEISLNDTCYTCHAEKRGPFLYEHAPVQEDCSICHLPHGSNQPYLLIRRPPQLCQGCHSAAGHRNLPQLADQIPPGGASEYLLAQGCTNCHAEVHGSNHPSGDKLRR